MKYRIYFELQSGMIDSYDLDSLEKTSEMIKELLQDKQVVKISKITKVIDDED